MGEMSELSPERSAHAALDVTSRVPKAKKIELLLELAKLPRPIQMLEVGTGSGGIAHYFATHPKLICHVAAVDVWDNRQVSDGYEFFRVRGVELPFPSERFDVVISNHVIEHIGDKSAQREHLAEIHRVLKRGGVCYLAAPNRWMITEPHYRLKFLSWLPRRWRTAYLRLRRRGDFYDCEPVQVSELENMLKSEGYGYQNRCITAWRTTSEIERPNAWSTHVLKRIPDRVLRPLESLAPTLIYRLERRL